MKTSILLAAAALTMCIGSASAAEPAHDATLVPWLAANGQFGYYTPEGKSVIAPKYTDAKPFVGGFAVVASGGHYGIVDATGKFIVPPRYAVARLFSVGRPGFALLVTKREYDAPWRFWQWRWLPDLNLLGGGNSGPLVVTKVPRAVWSVELLPSRKSLYSHNGPDDTGAMGTHRYWAKDWVPNRSLPRDLRMAVYGNVIKVDDKLWKLTDKGRLKRLPTQAARINYNGQLVVADGSHYRLADTDGKPIDDRILTPAMKITIATPEGAFDVSKTGEMGRAYPRIPYPIYQDQNGRVYLYPDFSKPFPRKVDDYHGSGSTINADLILHGAVMIWDVPKSPYFAVISTAAGNTRRLFLLDRNGHWVTWIPIYTDPHSMLSGGRITFGGNANRGVLNRQLQFQPLPLSSPIPCSEHPDWYMGKDIKTGKYGVFDAATQRWQVPPTYDYLQDETAPGVAIYSIVKKDAEGVKRDQFGLLDIAANKRITPPLYDRLETNGQVVRQVGGKRLSFYINRRTGYEYRSKPAP